jgi:hypothetical protein
LQVTFLGKTDLEKRKMVMQSNLHTKYTHLNSSLTKGLKLDIIDSVKLADYEQSEYFNDSNYRYVDD